MAIQVNDQFNSKSSGNGVAYWEENKWRLEPVDYWVHQMDVDVDRAWFDSTY